MDDKEVRIDSSLGTSIHNDCTKRLQNGNMPFSNREESYLDNSSHPLGKADTRPCAIIGPDRVLPSTDSSDVYMKTIPVEPWEYSDNYRYPYDSIKMADYHQTRNISPRQTFQENMQRIMVPPTYSSIKNSDEPSLKNAKLNVPTEGKYCDVPYSINTLSSEHKSVRSDSAMAAINPSFSRGVPPHGWHAGGGMQPLKPYPAHDYYQNTEYSSCTGPRPMPIIQPQRIVHEELLPIYPDRLYQESNIRFKPYPTSKEKFPQSRYEYIGPNTFQPPSQIPLHKFDVQKPMHGHHYSMYPQGPYKYVDRRYPEPMMDTYPRAPHPQSTTFHNQPMQPSYGPLPTNFYQAKPYPCPTDNSKSMHINKLSYDANNKIYLELENSRSKVYPSPDNFFYNDRAKFMRGDILVPGHTPMNTMVQQLYRKDNSPIKSYDHVSHYRHRDHHINLSNPLSRLPMQFSPNTIAISPCDSNTSNDTQMLGIPQEDCGYASQSSTTSVKSMDSNNGPADYYKRQGYNYTSATQNSSQRGNISSRSANSSDKKGLDVRQFLQMWNEGDEEDSENNNEVQNNSNYISSKTQASNSQEQLYVLGSITVPNEELSKYEHLQKVSKLPENIKGYNNIEILNQFEQLVESPNMNNYHVKKPSLKEYKVVSKSFTKNQSKEDLRRPVSPLDVEAKISQSVIHKEVGCNFEIKPCSPKVLNVDVATPIHDILGERLIEKVANPVLLSIGRGNENKIDESVDDPMEVTSCKMINATYSPNNSATVKPIYPLQDLDTNMGVCLASLPQLDNEIELNLPEVNQQFIDANKIETSCSPHSNLPVLENNHHESTFMKNKTNFQTNGDGQVVTYSEPDKETIKLSKYRKTKKVESVSNNYNVTSSSVPLTQRTDSVIIKNPENVKIQNETFNSFEIESSVVNNIIQNELNKPEISNNLFSSDNIVETAIDFSLSRNEPTSDNELTENACNLSTSILIEGSDFYKNNMDLSISTESSNQIKDDEIGYSNENKKSGNLSSTFVQDSTENESNKGKNYKDCIDNIQNAEENSKSNDKIADNLDTNKELQSDAPFYDYNSQILTTHENTKQKKEPEKISKDLNTDENNYHSDEESTKELKIGRCNFENNLPKLTSEPIITKHSDNILYSHLNNNLNNKTDETDLNTAFVRRNAETDTKETTNLHNTSNISNGAINTAVPMSCPEPASDCTSFIDNFSIQHESLIKDNIKDNKISNIDLLPKSTMETICIESDNKSLLSNVTTSFVSIKEKDEIISKSLITTKIESDISDLKSDDIIQTECCGDRSEMMSLDIATDNVSIEESNDTCNRNSLLISKDNDDLTSKNTIETPCSKSNKVMTKSDNIIQTEFCGDSSEMMSLDIATDNISIEESNDTCNRNSLLISKDNDDLTSKNTIETPCFKSNKVMTLSALSTDITNTRGKDEEYDKKSLIKSKVNIQSSDSKCDNIETACCKSYDETLFSSMPDDIVSTHEIHNELNQKSIMKSKNDFEENDLLRDDTTETTCYKNNKEILLLDVPPFIGTTRENDDKFNQNSPIIMIKNDIGDDDLVLDNTIQITHSKDNEILSLDVSKDIVPIKEYSDKFIRQSMVVNENCAENIDVKFDNTFETCSENEGLLLDNHIDGTCIKQSDDELKCKFNNNIKQRLSHGENFNTTEIVHYKRRIHRKALFSPWIQKLILYNINSHIENYNQAKNENIKVFNLDHTKKTESSVEEFSNAEKKVGEIGDAHFPQFLNECNDEDNYIMQEREENYKLCNTLTDFATSCKYSEKLYEIDSRCFVSSECEQNKMLRCTSPLTLSKNNSKPLRRTNKRSLSDTAIETRKYLEGNDEQLFSSKRYKKYEEGFVQSQMIATNLCNIIQTNRRNSISEIYNDVFILIDKDLILTEESEEQKLCFTDTESVNDNVEFNHENIDTIAENLPQDGKALWVEDVAHIETIFSDDIAEDVEISTPSSPKDSMSSDYETINNTSFMLCEEVIKNMENDVDIYELNMCKDNTYSIDTSCEFPGTKINKIFTCLESQNEEEIFTEEKTDSNRKKDENILNHLETSDTLFPKLISVNDDRVLDDKENLDVDSNLIPESATDSLHKSKIDSQHNNINKKFDEYNCALNPCNYPKYSSSPEVTSTTCEDKNPGILLKISNHKGSIVSQLDNDKSVIKNKISYKLTEKKTYKNYKPNFTSSGTLITKAAQKYIPPLKITMSDLKVKLPLPKNSLDKLKQLKKSKVEPKIDKNPLKSSSISTPREIKKQKPKFEDVLMSIDEFQYSKPKVKNKKVRNEIPKVVIKKNETGSHYTSSRCSNDQDRHNPDLTGRKWQPWVFLEKNSFIDKMALKHKVKAIYCRRKNAYVFAEKFRKYKSVYNAKFVISQPKTNDLKKGNLKYTIRLKHNN